MRGKVAELAHGIKVHRAATENLTRLDVACWAGCDRAEKEGGASWSLAEAPGCFGGRFRLYEGTGDSYSINPPE